MLHLRFHQLSHNTTFLTLPICQSLVLLTMNHVRRRFSIVPSTFHSGKQDSLPSVSCGTDSRMIEKHHRCHVYLYWHPTSIFFVVQLSISVFLILGIALLHILILFVKPTMGRINFLSFLVVFFTLSFAIRPEQLGKNHERRQV